MNVIAGFALAMGTVLLFPAAANAAGEIGLSSDGTTWASSLSAPLFDPAFRWIPGDREEASFWVRNESSDRATLDVAVLGSSIDSLMETGDLKVSLRAGNGPWLGTSATGRQELIASMPVAPGQKEKISVAVSFDPSSTNVSEVKQLDLKFDVRLTQDTSSGGGRDDDTDDGDKDDDDNGSRGRDGDLPGTGGLPWWVLPLGAGLTGAGVATVASARKERTDG